MKWLLAALFASLSFASAQAYTCDDVRALNSVQKAYYIRVFNITAAQQERIHQACYGPKTHQVTVAVEPRTNRLGYGERNARADQ